MRAPASTSKIAQFGVFELDLQRVELRKQGVRVKLQEQPLKVLQLLLENPGQIVSREQLRTRVWPANTFVEFDQGLYTAMARLRDALGDSAESPRFIETLPRRGYRFIPPVSVTTDLPAPELPVTQTLPAPGAHLYRLAASVLVGLIGGALLIGAVLGFNIGGAREWLRRQSSRPVTEERLTDFVGLEEFPAI